MANFNRSSIVLAINRALWGEVWPTMRLVCARVHGRKFQIRIVFDGAASDAESQSMARIGAAAVTGDFKELTLDIQPIRLDAPAALTVEDGWALVYQRRE